MTNEQHYIYPPRPQDALPRGDHEIFAQLDWIAQLKFNDSRCLIKILGDGRIQLWSRHAERLKYFPPIQLQEQLETLKRLTKERLGNDGYCLFDGGLLHNKHKAIKDTLVIWDVLVLDGEHLVGTDYAHRYTMLEKLYGNEQFYYKDYRLGNEITENIFYPDIIPPQSWENTWNTIDEINEPFLSTNTAGPLIEGLVFKDPDGLLEPGYRQNNNSGWLARSRVKTNRHIF